MLKLSQYNIEQYSLRTLLVLSVQVKLARGLTY